MKRRQTQRPKSTSAEVLQNLLDTYLSGGAKNGMSWKRWTIRDKADGYYEFWVKSEGQRQRVLAKGGNIEAAQLHKTPGDMLRELAEEYDRRCAEAKKEDE